jgi:hypothetical protein
VPGFIQIIPACESVFDRVILVLVVCRVSDGNRDGMLDSQHSAFDFTVCLDGFVIVAFGFKLQPGEHAEIIKINIKCPGLSTIGLFGFIIVLFKQF